MYYYVNSDESHDRRGKLIFDRSPAKDLLRQDIKDGAYPRLSPMQLWNTRPEYKLFDLNVFKGRIYQEISFPSSSTGAR